jgi:hypothetical protein
MSASVCAIISVLPTYKYTMARRRGGRSLLKYSMYNNYIYICMEHNKILKNILNEINEKDIQNKVPIYSILLSDYLQYIVTLREVFEINIV